MPQELLLEMKNITKLFPGVRALSGVNLSLSKGEVLAVVGENGAGKSTLMNIVLGSIQPNEGEMVFKGKKFTPRNPAEALNSGISMIHQELTLVPEMSVSENIWLGQENKFIQYGLVQVGKRDEASGKILADLKININAQKKVKSLTVAEMQLVEIARAVSYESEIIIMDEPTSSLTSKEINLLYEIVRSLTKKGIAVTFITHKLDEVFAICDNVMIMRDGHFIDCKPVKEITSNEMIAKMVGRDVSNLFPKEDVEIGDVVLEVKNLTRKGYFENVNFSVKAGQILGFCGLIGAGRSEVMECVFGIEKSDSGEIFMRGKKIKVNSPRDAIAHHMGMVTEDRLRRGVIHMLSVKFNVALAYLPTIVRQGFVNDKKMEEDCNRMKGIAGIKASSLNQLAGQLSGGNQQKAIIAKWLLTESEVIIFDEPTRGIDVGSKAEIYKLLCTLAKQGKAIIMVSSELPEIMAMSDRMIIMANGKVIACLDRNEYEENKIMQYAFGYNNDSKSE
ncbi:monosaccharide-transporting ATPase [Spirochaetia bacterium]|nr:monosaccharide-transporting ATPase [Spirochaetia bacterium]